MSTTVVIGSCPGRDYSFPLPIGCLLWRDAIGHAPHAFLVGTAEEWSTGQAGVTAAMLAECRIRHTVVELLPGHTRVAMAKHVRQHAAALVEYSDDEWLMPSDADLWPLRRDFYHQHEGRAQKAVFYFINGDGFLRGDESVEEIATQLDETRRRAALDFGYKTIPMCHITMRAATWRQVWEIEPGDVGVAMKKTFAKHRVGDASGQPDHTIAARSWWADSDQRVATAILCEQPWFATESLFIPRPNRDGPPDDRMDRSRARGWQAIWNARSLAARWTDAHIPRNPDEEGPWRVLDSVVSALIPQHAKLVREYRKMFRAAGK